MADNPGPLTELALRLQIVAAGLLGGLSSSIVQNIHSGYRVIGMMIVGAATAYYVCGFVARYTGTDLVTAGYLIGLAGFPFCLGVYAYVQWLFPKTGKGSSDVDPSQR